MDLDVFLFTAPNNASGLGSQRSMQCGEVVPCGAQWATRDRKFNPAMMGYDFKIDLW
jgi:hypothetical protein